MLKAFLSHSSKDKELYVNIVANYLGATHTIIDSDYFRTGEKTLEEIYKGLGDTDIFVLFISNSALNSPWVKKEIAKANQLLIIKKINQFYPIIIDRGISLNDDRIPVFLKENYILRHVTRPTVAARLIKQKLRELSWIRNPYLSERENLFVGRNELLAEIEQRFDNLDLPSPICMVATGLTRIGRKALLFNGLIKTNLKNKVFRPVILTLTREESIEDFIRKLNDTGLTREIDFKNLLKYNMEVKINILKNQLQDIIDSKEILFIEDNECIFSYYDDHMQLSEWFKQIIQHFQDCESLFLCITTRLRLTNIGNDLRNAIFIINVPELDKIERNGLFKRYSEIRKLNLNKEDLNYFAGSLTGFPEQAIYAVELILEKSLPIAKKNTYLITEFNANRIIEIMRKYEKNRELLNIIIFLSRHEFVSYDFLFQIFIEDTKYYRLINELIENSIVELIGVNKEYLRLNNTVKDFISRQGRIELYQLPDEYSEKTLLFIRKVIENDDFMNLDESEYFISIKEALLNQIKISDFYIAPSHILKTMIELYHRKKDYSEVEKLAKSVLDNSSFLDDKIRREVQYYLCLSLARQGDIKFLEEVREISGSDHQFLMGFYYRQIGDYQKALARLQDAIEKRPNFTMAKRELVLVYIGLEEYTLGLQLAKDNYEKYKNNEHNIQGYFICVLKSDKSISNRKILEGLLVELESLGTDTADEMRLNLHSQFECLYNDNKSESDEIIDLAIIKYPDSLYSYLTKFDNAEKYNDVGRMEEAIIKIESRKLNNRSHFFKAFIVRKAIFLAYHKRKTEALNLIRDNLSNMPEKYKEKIKAKITII